MRFGEQVGVAHKAAGNLDTFCGDAQFSTANSTIAKNFGGDPLSRVTGYGKADALGHGDHCRVDSHDMAARVEQWSAAVAWIDGCRVLDDAFDHASCLAAHAAAVALTTPVETVDCKPVDCPWR